MKDFKFYLEEAKKKKAAKKPAKKSEDTKIEGNASHTAFPCPNCKGYGKLEKEDNAICPVCKGRGEFNSDDDRKSAVEQQKINAKVKPEVKGLEEPKKKVKKS
jgi:RecJ-like exonuclease